MRHRHTPNNKRKSMSFYDETHMNGQFALHEKEKTTKQQSIEPVFSLRDLSSNTKLLFSSSFSLLPHFGLFHTNFQSQSD